MRSSRKKLKGDAAEAALLPVYTTPGTGELPVYQDAKGKGSGKKKRHRVRNGILIGLLVLVVAIVTTGVVVYMQLNGTLHRESITNMMGGDRPTNVASVSDYRSMGDPFAGQAVNILVIGSDSRSGANSAQANDGVTGERSDTTLIVHVSADRTRIDAVSIPRDTLITIPNCVYEDGTRVPGSGAVSQKFNAAFSYGSMGQKGTVASGVACAIKAVEAMSNVRIDEYIVVDFAGFQQIVNAIHGVDIYLPCAVVAPKADNLDLPKGVNHLSGKVATAYARARTGQGLGDGSDLMRIQRQQALFEAVAVKVLSMNVLTDLKPLYQFVSAVAGAVTTDLGNITDIAGFAYSMRGMDVSSLTFTTVPVGAAGDGSSVLVQTLRAAPIWQALNKDTALSDVVGVTSLIPRLSTSSTDATGSDVPPGMVSAPADQCNW